MFYKQQEEGKKESETHCMRLLGTHTAHSQTIIITLPDGTASAMRFSDNKSVRWDRQADRFFMLPELVIVMREQLWVSSGYERESYAHKRYAASVERKHFQMLSGRLALGARASKYTTTTADAQTRRILREANAQLLFHVFRETRQAAIFISFTAFAPSTSPRSLIIWIYLF